MTRALGYLFLVTSLLSGTGLHAQSGCDDPFADSAALRFSTRFWERTDFCLHSVPYDEILSGGVAPDGIPPIDDPQFEPVAAAREWLQDQSPVIVLVLEGEARAYPLAILTWHEIVNDQVGEIPVAVTFCPLCNSSIVFDRRVAGETLRFGVSGNLRNSDMVMWDDLTQSWWQQLTGEGIVGTYTGTQLTFLPSQVAGFADFASAYPDGAVLSRATGHSRNYGINPYANYEDVPPFLFEGGIDQRLPATEHVLAGLVGGQAIAYPMTTLAEQQVINDTVGAVPVAAFWQDGAVSALDARVIDDSRTVGTAALYHRVIDGQTLTFAVDDDGLIRDEQTGTRWNVFGLAVEGALAGQQLTREIAGPHFWFAWAAFRPETTVYGIEQP